MNASSFDIKDLRQPMVTSLGVMLGFLVGFLGQWVTDDHFALNGTGDHVVFYGCFVSVWLLLSALFRILQPQASGPEALRFYRWTLRLYMSGVVCALLIIFTSAFLG